MQTECIAEQLEFSGVEKRRVVAQFDGGPQWKAFLNHLTRGERPL